MDTGCCALTGVADVVAVAVDVDFADGQYFHVQQTEIGFVAMD